MTYNILLLEDNQDQFKAYKQALEDDRLENSYNLLHVKNIQEAHKTLNENQIHAAILDLKVPFDDNNDPQIENGISYLEEILAKKQFPVIVVSANTSSLPDDPSKLPNHLIRMDRSAGVHSKAFEHFESIKDLLEISPLFPETLSEITHEFQEAFWEMWGHWEQINSRFNTRNTNITKTFLKRYISSYLIEKWNSNELFNKLHHSEFYTYPLTKDRIHTGDIILENNKYWIVITAPCDLSNSKEKYPENLTLLHCRLEDISEKKYIKIVAPFRNTPQDKNAQESKIKATSELFTKQNDGEHYLPPWTRDGYPLTVEFKQIKTLPFNTEDAQDKIKSKRTASLSSHFMPYLLQRYGAYVSRIGQSDISAEDYIHYLLSVVPEPEVSP